jgi:hypothetical protein
MIVAKKSKKTKKSQRYRVYPMSSNRVVRDYGKYTPLPKKSSKWTVVGELMKGSSQFQHSGWVDSFKSEFLWETEGKNAIFLNLDDINTITRGKCSVKFIPDKLLPFKSFMICLPAEYEVFGERPSGILVNSFDSQSEWSRDVNKFYRGVFPESDQVGHDGNDGWGKGITITYKDRCGKKGASLRLHDKDLDLAINSNSFSEFLCAYGDNGGVDTGFTQGELKIQYTLFKLVLSLSMYIKAKPEALADGFPANGGFSLSERFPEPVRGSTVNLSTKHNPPPEEHHRGWFIRQLVAECYYRGEYKDLEPGSRMVFVDETTVNLKVASHNVQGNST